MSSGTFLLNWVLPFGNFTMTLLNYKQINITQQRATTIHRALTTKYCSYKL